MKKNDGSIRHNSSIGPAVVKRHSLKEAELHANKQEELNEKHLARSHTAPRALNKYVKMNM